MISGLFFVGLVLWFCWIRAVTTHGNYVAETILREMHESRDISPETQLQREQRIKKAYELI